MFIIKLPGPVIFSMIFSPKFLACASLKNFGNKTIENFPVSLKYNAKHWAYMFMRSVFECLRFTTLVVSSYSSLSWLSCGSLMAANKGR